MALRDPAAKDGRMLPAWIAHIKWQHLAAGISGGVVSTMALQPLDLVKVRLQVHEGTVVAGVKRPAYSGFTHALTSIYRERGVRGWYQGATPNVVGAGASWGLYFFFYNAAKSVMQSGDSSHALNAGQHILCATSAGALTLVMTNPIWVTKTRLYLQYERGATAGVAQYNGMFDALVKIVRQEGIRGLYRGMVPGLFGVSHGALQFMAYEDMKNRYNTYYNRPIDVKLATVEYLAFAALSKTFAATATYPYQVVRSRLQDQHRKYSGNVDVIRQIWRYERVGGFYKGLVPSLIRVTPACCVTFVVYEKMTAWLIPPKNRTQ